MKNIISNLKTAAALLAVVAMAAVSLPQSASAAQVLFKANKTYSFSSDLVLDKKITATFNPNNDLAVSFKVQNVGNLPTPKFVMKVVVKGSKQQATLSRTAENGFDAKESGVFTPVFSRKVTATLGDIEHITVVIDTENSVKESDETNNSGSVTVDQEASKACNLIADKMVCGLRNDCTWRVFSGGCVSVNNNKPKILPLKPIVFNQQQVKFVENLPDLLVSDIWMLPRMNNKTLLVYGVKNAGKLETKDGFEHSAVVIDNATPPRSATFFDSNKTAVAVGATVYKSILIPMTKKDISNTNLTIKSLAKESNPNNNAVSWNLGNDKAMPICKDSASEGLCNANPICEWKWSNQQDVDTPNREGKCNYRQCEALKDKNDCETNLMGCEWVTVEQQNQIEPVQRCQLIRSAKPTNLRPSDDSSQFTLAPYLSWDYPENISASFRWYVEDAVSGERVWERDWVSGQTSDLNCLDAKNQWVCHYATVPEGLLKWSKTYRWYVEARENSGNKASSQYTDGAKFSTKSSNFIGAPVQVTQPQAQTCGVNMTWVSGSGCQCLPGAIPAGDHCNFYE